MDGEYSTAGQVRAGLALQSNAVQGSAGQDRAGQGLQGRTYSAVSQKRLTV